MNNAVAKDIFKVQLALGLSMALIAFVTLM